MKEGILYKCTAQYVEMYISTQLFFTHPISGNYFNNEIFKLLYAPQRDKRIDGFDFSLASQVSWNNFWEFHLRQYPQLNFKTLFSFHEQFSLDYLKGLKKRRRYSPYSHIICEHSENWSFVHN